MAFIIQCGGENIGFTTIFQLQSLAQFCHGKGEITGGDIRLGDSGKMTLQLLLIKGRNGDDAETSAWECFDRRLAHEKMTVLGKHPCIIAPGKNAETAGFHQRCIRLIKILHLFKGGWGYLHLRRLHIQLIADEGLRIVDAINAEIFTHISR